MAVIVQRHGASTPRKWDPPEADKVWETDRPSGGMSCAGRSRNSAFIRSMSLMRSTKRTYEPVRSRLLSGRLSKAKRVHLLLASRP